MTTLHNSPGRAGAVTDTGSTGAPGTVDGLVRPPFLGNRRQRRGRSTAWRFSVPLGLLAAWQISSSAGWLDPQILSPPSSVLTAVSELWKSGQLVDFLLASGRRAALGAALGLAIGTFLGVMSGLSARGEQLIDPTMQMFRAVPFLALVPLFLAWFGVEESFKIVLIAVASLAPMYAYSYLGVRSVDRKLIEAAKGFGLRGPALVRTVILPTALPNLLMGVRISLSVSLTGLIAAEQIGTTEGIGYLVSLSQQFFRNDYMVLCILLYALLGLLIDAGIRLIERLAMPWRAGVNAR